MNPPDSELRELCDRLLDGDFTVEDRARLEALVLGDAELRRLYVEIMHQHAALRQNASRLGDLPLAEVLRTLPLEGDAPSSPQSGRLQGEINVIPVRFRRRWLRLAAAVAVGLGIWWFAPSPAEKP